MNGAGGAAGPAFGPARAREGKRFAGGWPRCQRDSASGMPPHPSEACALRASASGVRSCKICVAICTNGNEAARSLSAIEQFLRKRYGSMARMLRRSSSGLHQSRWPAAQWPSSKAVLPVQTIRSSSITEPAPLLVGAKAGGSLRQACMIDFRRFAGKDALGLDTGIFRAAPRRSCDSGLRSRSALAPMR